MHDLDPKWLKKLKKLENLPEIEARLARQEKNTRIAVIVGTILAVFAFALLLGRLAPSVAAPPPLRLYIIKGLMRNLLPSPSSDRTGSTSPLIIATPFSWLQTNLQSGTVTPSFP